MQRHGRQREINFGTDYSRFSSSSEEGGLAGKQVKAGKYKDLLADSGLVELDTAKDLMDDNLDSRLLHEVSWYIAQHHDQFDFSDDIGDAERRAKVADAVGIFVDADREGRLFEKYVESTLAQLKKGLVIVPPDAPPDPPRTRSVAGRRLRDARAHELRNAHKVGK